MFSLYRHQEVALAYLRMNDSFALFMEQGTGKTLVALSRILDLLKDESIDNALIVAPKSALGAWERDAELFEPEDRDLLQKAITLINYDRVWRGGEKSPYYQSYGCIVLDEAHNIKNRTSKRSDFLLRIACMSKYRYILTGTPISNGQLENIWSLYCFLEPGRERGYPYSKIFGGTYPKFQSYYCNLDQYYKPCSYKHVHELQDIIADHCYRVKKADCLDLPDKLPDEIVKVDLMEKGLYKRLATKSALLEYEILAENPLSRLVKLRQMASGFLKRDDGTIEELKCDKPKILQELIEGYADDEKIVIFAEFKHSIQKICATLDKMSIRHVTLDGEQKNKTIWREFQKDPAIRVIVCQYQTANAGIDLYASSTIIYYEPTLRSQVLEQSRDRIHRTGQKNVCSYIHLLTTGTVEVAIYHALAGFGDFSEKLFSEYMETYSKRRTR